MHSTALKRAEIEQEGRAIITKIAKREPAKIFAINVGIKPRHCYNLRDEETDTRWPTFVMMAMQYPDLRAWLLKKLGADGEGGTSDDNARTLVEIQRLLQARIGSGS